VGAWAGFGAFGLAQAVEGGAAFYDFVNLHSVSSL
jgi:hypothetical protein